MPSYPDQQPQPLEPKTATKFKFSIWCLKAATVVAIIGLGALYGVTAYKYFFELLSDTDQGSSGLMLVSFLIGIPTAIGLLVGFLAIRRRITGLAGASLLSTFSIALFIFAAGAYLREGAICIVMAAPLFLVFAIFGAIVGVLISKTSGENSPKLFSIALVLPFFIAPGEEKMTSPSTYQLTQEDIYIAAKPENIWQHINSPTNIQPAELESGFAYKIGVPYPIEARTIEGRVGGSRILRWQRGVEFEELITAWQPNSYIAWDYKFSSESFPAGSLDDHIVIGGRYFDLEATSYRLTPEGQGTRLAIEVRTRVTTNFNWYASLWAKYLIADTAKAILNFYKVRSELDAT
jgi:hypothetical protein